MTKEDVSRQLRYMEHIRELSYEADTKRERKRLELEYEMMWKNIEPYVTGAVPYSQPANK